MNPSETQTVTAEFNLTLINLVLQDAGEEDNTFRVVMEPKAEAFKVLLPTDRSKNTSIKMGYSFSAEE